MTLQTESQPREGTTAAEPGSEAIDDAPDLDAPELDAAAPAESEAVQQTATVINEALAPLPEWARLLALVVAFVVAITIAHRIIFAILSRITKPTGKTPTRQLVDSTRRPAFALLAVVAISTALAIGSTLGLTGGWFGPGIKATLAALLAIAITWLAIGFIQGVDDMVLARYKVDVKDNLKARRMHTQIAVISRTLSVVVGIFGIGVALMQFDQVERIGTSLLASAGIAGIAIGFAARPVLGNIIAGIQIALTQPIRLDDAVVIEGEWGWIEEITTTYVVVKIWDQRRLIVPFSKIIEEPFQNWTRKSAEILGSITLHADYTLPVDDLRNELTRLCQANDKWDSRVCVLQVTDAEESTIKLRALVSAEDSPTAWDLRCEIREQLIDYIQREHPNCLPRSREIEYRAGSERNRPEGADQS
ncbi:MAG: mechanosensitive ion channel family protein [Planctomycetota bacterium]